MTLTLSQMAQVEGGGANKVMGIACGVAGVATAVSGFFTLGFGWVLGGAMVSSVCAGYGLAAALDS
jgi:hypothetical protein